MSVVTVRLLNKLLKLLSSVLSPLFSMIALQMFVPIQLEHYLSYIHEKLQNLLCCIDFIYLLVQLIVIASF